MAWNPYPEKSKKRAPGLWISPCHNPGCLRVPGPTDTRARMHQGTADLGADDAITIYYIYWIETSFIPRGSAKPVDD